MKYQTKQRDTVLLIYLGRPYDSADSNYMPVNKWMKVVVPLPKNQTVEMRIVTGWLSRRGGGYPGYRHGIDTWIDDFKIISK
jgi:hypothetical protein